MTVQNQLTKESVSNTLRAFIKEEFLYDEEDAVIEDDMQLIEQGVIDSMGIFRLIAFVEAEFNILIEAEEVVMDNFASVENMTSLILAKE